MGNEEMPGEPRGGVGRTGAPAGDPGTRRAAPGTGDWADEATMAIPISEIFKDDDE